MTEQLKKYLQDPKFKTIISTPEQCAEFMVVFLHEKIILRQELRKLRDARAEAMREFDARIDAYSKDVETLDAIQKTINNTYAIQ